MNAMLAGISINDCACVSVVQGNAVIHVESRSYKYDIFNYCKIII